MYRKTWIAAAAVLAAGYAFAADTPAIERPSALDTLSYTAIPRVVYNSAGATSYLRFGNGSGATANFEVKVTGGETGTDYTGSKSYTLSVPDKASVQKSIDDIRAAITAAGGSDIALKSGDTFLNLYVTSDKKGAGVGFQHVTFNGNTGFFENVSQCTYDPTQDYSSMTKRVINVHTSRLNGYPSRVEIHNPDSTTRAVRGKVYDATSGTSLGSFTTNVAANSTAVVEESSIEQQISFTPSSSQLHINIEFETADSSSYSAVVAHKVTQSSTGAVFNLTQICAVNPTRTAPTSNCTTTGGSTTGGGTTTNPSGTTKEFAAADTPSGSTGGTGTGSGSGNTSCSTNNDTFAAVGDTLTQTFTVGQQATISLSTLTANDTKATGATLDSVTAFLDASVGGAPNGTYAATASGITYTPARAGTVTFTYKLKSSSGETSNSATVILTVSSSSADALKANNDTLTTTFQVGQPVSISLASLTANDTNVTSTTNINDVTPFVDSSGNANGTYTQLPTIITYVPAKSGTVTFTYRLSAGNGGGLSNYATVTLTVGDPNLPRPANDTLTQGFAAGIATTIPLSSLTSNDTNASGATLEQVTAFVDAGTTTANGTYTVAAGNGGIIYTPARAGTVTFTYRLRNGSGLSEPATATLTVGAGSSAAPTATDKTISYIVTFPNSIEILPSDILGTAGAVGVEFDAGATTITSFTSTSGTVVSLTPLVTKIIADFPVSGSAAPVFPFSISFNYRLKNSVGTSSTARLTVNVTKP